MHFFLLMHAPPHKKCIPSTSALCLCMHHRKRCQTKSQSVNICVGWRWWPISEVSVGAMCKAKDSPSGLDGGWFLSLLRSAILSLGSWGTMITLSKRGRQVFLSFRQSHPSLPPLSKERLILATPLCASFHKVSLTHFFIFGKAIPSSSIALLPKHNPALLR